MRKKLILYFFTLMAILIQYILAGSSQLVGENIKQHDVIGTDQIYLADGKIFKGKIVMVSKEMVEYIPEGNVKADYIKRSSVFKIVYGNKKEVILNPALNIKKSKDIYHNRYDAIYLKNNTIKYGNILQITEKNIEYDPEGKYPFGVCARKDVDKIIYKKGEVISFDKKYRDNRKSEFDTKTSEDSLWYVGFGQAFYSGMIDIKGIDDVHPEVPSSDDRAIMYLGFNFNVGYILNKNWHLGFDFTIAGCSSLDDLGYEDSDEYPREDPEINDDMYWQLIIVNYLGSVKMFFWEDKGLFGKISAGYTYMEVSWHEEDGIFDIKKSDGLTIHIGGGYDWKVGKKFFIGINVEYFYNHYFDDKYFSNAHGVLVYSTTYWK